MTITVAKRKGTNATYIANAALKRIDEMKGVQIPNDVNVTTTRNYGETAKAKSDELLEHLLLATLSVTLLVALLLGWRESGVVLLAIPVTLALTHVDLLFPWLHHQSRHAVRTDLHHRHSGGRRHRCRREYRAPLPVARKPAAAPAAMCTVEAVDEVGNPTILATFAVIAAVLPMAFVRGLMGPYMRPIPVGASAAMLFSLDCGVRRFAVGGVASAAANI